MPEIPKTSGKRRLFLVVPVLIVLLPLGFSVALFVVAQVPQPSQLFLERPEPKYEECIKETSYMRFHHWELLRGIREEIVRYGKRGEVGLKKCKECHTSRERFCDQCHKAVSMTPDCFGCHFYP